MNPLRHAMLARQLIKACGGLTEAEGVCRLNRSRLSDFQNLGACEDPKSGAFMPIDVVAELEAYCGEPIYSAAVAAERPAAATPESLLSEACQLTEESGALLKVCRLVARDGQTSAHERRLIESGLLAILGEVDELRAAAHRPGHPGQGRLT